MRLRVAVIAIPAVLVVAAGALAFVNDSPVRNTALGVMRHECFLPSAPADQERSAVGLGDSITAGRRIDFVDSGASDSYFDVLACDEGVAFVGNAGVRGETSTDILARVDRDVIAKRPRLALVLAGTNDVRQRDTSRTIANLDAIAGKLQRAGITAIFGTLPPVDVLPRNVQDTNDQIRAWAAQRGVTLIDFWAVLAGTDGKFASGMSRDGTHPTPAGAALMAAEARRVLTPS